LLSWPECRVKFTVVCIGLLPVREADPGPAGEWPAGGQVGQLQGHTQDTARDIPASAQPQVRLILNRNSPQV